MADTLPAFTPITLGRPRGAHRFEAFSPKLARRVTFYRRALLEQWLLLEANPKVVTFCERQGYVLINEDRHLADFWMRYVDREELVVPRELLWGSDADGSCAELDADTTEVRFVASAELSAARAWTDNWQRILPYLVANRGLVPATLPSAVVQFVEEPRRLLDIEREFLASDPVIFRAALFGPLHSGRVSASSLQTQPLSLLTSFTALEATTWVAASWSCRRSTSTYGPRSPIPNSTSLSAVCSRRGGRPSCATSRANRSGLLRNRHASIAGSCTAGLSAPRQCILTVAPSVSGHSSPTCASQNMRECVMCKCAASAAAAVPPVRWHSCLNAARG
jgi:hypothetical protein